MSKNKKNHNKSNKKPNNIKNTQSKTEKKISAASAAYSQDLLKEYGLEAEPNVEFKDEAPEAVESEKTTKKSGFIPSHADSIGWNKPKILARNFLYGIFMGFSDGVPGYSGGTTLTIIGFYQQLIHNFKLIFKPDVNKYFWKYLIWFLPFVLAWGGMLYGFMQVVDIAAQNNMGIVLVFLFGSFAFFSIPLFLITNKKDMVRIKDLPKALKNKEKWSYVHWFLIIFAFLVMVSIGIGARFIPETETDGGVIIGVTFALNNQDWVNTYSSDSMSVVFIILAAFIAGFAMLIPGVSGSLVLFMTGWYPKISQAITGIQSNPNYILFLVLVAIGLVCGVIFSSFAITWMLKKWEKAFYSLSFGLVSGAFIAIFVSLSSHEYAFLSDGTTLGLALAMIPVALIINVLIFIVLNETKKIDFPKFKILNRNNTDTAVKN